MAIMLEPIQREGALEAGQFILVEKKNGGIFPAEVKQVLRHEDGEEIVFSLGRNRYFNTRMMLAGDSWVKSVSRVPDCQANVAINNLREYH